MKKSQFAISVIIPTYNRCKYLRYTLNSLVKQTLDKSRFEVVIVDDGSSDDTFQMVKSYEGVLNFKYVYQVDEGYRAGSARNLGIRVADGTICLFIDSGILVKKDCLRYHLDCHEQHKKEVAIIGYTYGYGANEDLLASINMNDADDAIAKLVAKSAFLDMRENIYQKYADRIEDLVAPWTLFWGGHLSVRKKSLFEIGLFDEQYDGRWGCEDNDLGYRLHKANKKIVLCRQAAVLHLPHASDWETKSQEGYENCQYFNQKFQTDETQIFLDYYIKETTEQASSLEVVDFHKLITHSKIVTV